jgi:hypothetical protein
MPTAATGGSETIHLTPCPKRNTNFLLFLPVLPETLQSVFPEVFQAVLVEVLPELGVFLHKPCALLLSEINQLDF